MIACIIIGTYSWRTLGISAPGKPAGVTPMMVKTWPLSLYFAADDVGLTRKSGLPEIVADDRHRMSARRHIVGRGEQPAACGADAEEVEEVARDDEAADELGGVAGIEAGGDAAPPGESLEHLAVIAQRRVEGVREHVADVAAVHVGEPFGVRDREPLQQRGIDEAEHRGVGADAQREGEHRRRGEAGLLTQHPDRIAHILPEIRHDAPSCRARRNRLRDMRLAQRSHLALQGIRLTQLLEGQPPRNGVVRALGAQLLVAVVEVLRQLVDDLRLARSAEPQLRQARAQLFPPVLSCLRSR